MGKRANPRPEHLPAKLLAIRKTLGLSQPQIAKLLEIKASRISEFELGRRTPNLVLALSYARLIGVPLEHMADDETSLETFKSMLRSKSTTAAPFSRSG